MASVHRQGSHLPPHLQISLLLFLIAALTFAACAPQQTPPPAPLATPSKVITEEGIEFYVWGLKLPGTNQILRLRAGGALTWLPLNIVGVVGFSGPATDGFRQADINLISGEKVHGELYVGHLIEGDTDLGYWNMPLERVRILSMGTQ